MIEITSHNIRIKPNIHRNNNQPGTSDPVLYLEGYQKTDIYATNLELTGYTSWFGSQNMCNMIADHSHELFNSYSEDTNNILYDQRENDLHFIELGSGLGKGGIMVIKTLANEGCFQSKCILSDGEDEIVDLLQRNCNRNIDNDRIKYQCMKLLWGDTVVLEELLLKYPLGFDIIIGCDLIYGSSGSMNLEKLLYSVSVLLKKQQPHTSLELCTIDHNKSILDKNIFKIDPYNIRYCSAFYLAITRREFISFEIFESICNKYGLTCANILDDYTFDIFDNQVDSSSMFWRDTIIRITHII